MISVEEARRKIENSVKRFSRSEIIPVEDAAGRTLFTDVYAGLNLPPFDQSAVDGYAVNTGGSETGPWKVTGELKAGDEGSPGLGKGEAIRIFTGAKVPPGTETVVMQEHVSQSAGLLNADKPVIAGQNIRTEGSQIRKGQKAIEAGCMLNPASVGFLAGLGLTSVEVYRKPVINIIVTGDELAKPGTELSGSLIYESNSVTIRSFLQACGYLPASVQVIGDDKKLLLEGVKEAVEGADIVLLTGGISVGKYDFVKETLSAAGAEEIFYKIKQKPGKPLYFASAGDTLFFALPGNPAAVLTCLYEYVYPAINLLAGRKDISLKKVMLPLLADYRKKPGLVNYLKGKIAEGGVLPMEGQESFILKSFSEADALIMLPEDCADVKKGDMVEVHLLPFWN
jgi:molybdopterin molybdotransferase